MIADANSYEVQHIMYVRSGRISVMIDDVSGEEFGLGDTSFLPLGHNTWLVGYELIVAVDIPETYAKK